MRAVLEKTIEKRSREKTEQLGGKLIKLIPFIINGLPDRIVILPNKPIFFVEFKRVGEKPRKLQLAIHNMLRKLGQCVYVVDSIDQYMKILNHHRQLSDYDFGTDSEKNV